ncbi:tyrosine-type recombinase/integrase [Chamaesiphon polymorphus]|uniref:Site-specific integrase n=1 Tax=Chamaesiphon polymorphus CCALA 037 TaxID=2107692 RepID=A0A2T1GJ17_9CYAN|nr:site-specific integrase [Chamaesiphon polymorphus]PSB57759.1 site-specific integrase [Chamaesiphon polymorphus CCALA 037]
MSTGKVWIETTGGTLRACWRHNGKTQKMSLGLPDNKLGRVVAEQKIAVIEADLISGNYDETKLKYRPRKGKNGTVVSAAVLFEKYAAQRLKAGELSHSSKVRLKGIASKLEVFLGDTLAEKVDRAVAEKMVEEWLATASPRTIKERLFDLRACWGWARGKYHIAKDCPWSDCLERMKRKAKSKPQQKIPFTIAELQTIRSETQLNSSYSHYTDFIIFLANMGCRPGEAAALRWKHISPDRSNAWIGESISRGHRNTKGTKTGDSRTLLLNSDVRAMLAARFERLQPQPDDLVFTSPLGFAINDNNFCKRVWKPVLSICGIEYRPPYNLRHTAESRALSNKADPVALARQAGHSPKTMFATYAHEIDPKCLYVNVGEL